MSRAVTAMLIVFVVATRWATAPDCLHAFDGVNFALAIDDFDPSRHQPQPPGYIFFVGLLRAMHFIIPRAEDALVAVGILGSCVAVLLAGRAGEELFGRRAALLAMALLASDPVLWFGALANQVRVFLAVWSAAIALLAWRAISEPDRPRRLYIAFAALGIATGFRPETALVLMPLLLWTWWRTGGSPKRLALAAAVFGAGALSWVAVTATVVGGVERLGVIFWAYVYEQFRGSSALFGAGASPARKMAIAGVVWMFLGAAAWLWAVPFAFRHEFWKGRGALLAMWFFPPFLFSTLIHIGDPDQALAGIAALSVIGGAVLSRLRFAPVLGVAALALHTVMFLWPPGELARAASYRAIADVDRSNARVLGAIEGLRRNRPVTIVSYSGPVTFRHLTYYFPDDYVVILPGSPAQPLAGEPMHIFHQRKAMPPPRAVGVLHPGSRRVICVLPPGAPVADWAGWRGRPPVLYLDGDPPREVAVGPHRLVLERP